MADHKLSKLIPLVMWGGATVVVLCVYVCVWGGGGGRSVCACVSIILPHTLTTVAAVNCKPGRQEMCHSISDLIAIN